MTSEYLAHVTASTRSDAIDVARRRARDDGYRPVGEARVTSVPGTVDRWAVTLRVVAR